MLPVYTPSSPTSPTSQAARSEHVVSLQGSKGHKWLSLYVNSRAATAASLPLLFQGDSVTGRVELDLQKEETIKAIVVSVLAGTTAVGQEESRFLQIDNQLWPPIAANSKGPSSQKIKGRHSWTFTMSLPTTVPVTEPNGRHGQYPLPPTFSERASPVYIDYRVKVVVRRGMFKVDQPLTLSFGYSPVAYPEAPSALRRMAYNEGSLLIGPEGDPEGWKVCETVKAKGTLFSVRAVEVECSLCYAIGTPIPIEITLRSNDKQALDLLATPEALRVYLVRSMTTGSDAMDDDAPRRSNSHFLESVGDAYFWIQPESKSEGANSEGGLQGGGREGRLLRGEIEVQKTLKPSFKFPRFAMRVRSFGLFIRWTRVTWKIVHDTDAGLESTWVHLSDIERP
ncbi:hypothetical protein EYR40_007742 [Pleurotus pulmonarius]|nr:hypothetical protein EYR38_007948 [Pleurotus pulmonarius]KAF4597290.1 hypothetical protein EYR40_007742 [Pleurotus pulmonarius]